MLENLLLYGPASRASASGARVAALARPRDGARRSCSSGRAAIARAARISRACSTTAPPSLSGGQKKLLEIGRALMAEPKLLLLDEPVAGVNPTLAREIGEHLRALVADGITVLLIEHHMDTIAALCDHVVVHGGGTPPAPKARSPSSPPIRSCRRPTWAGGRMRALPDRSLRVRRASSPAMRRARRRSSRACDLRVDEGEIVGIIGPNGAGKSTLLKTIAGLLHPAQRQHPAARRADRTACRRARSAGCGVAYVPQEQNVFPTMTVRENLEMGGYVDPAATRAAHRRGVRALPDARANARGVRRARSRAGERQVLAMAMALMVEPALLLLDEPSAGLSPIAAEQLFDDDRRDQPRRRRDRHGRAERHARPGRSRIARTFSSTAATVATERPPRWPPIRRSGASFSADERASTEQPQDEEVDMPITVTRRVARSCTAPARSLGGMRRRSCARKARRCSSAC